MRPELSEGDIIRLMKGETSEERATVAHRLCRRIAVDVLSDEERQFADEIIQILAQDTAELVRPTLSVTLRNSPRLPHNVAVQLAQDVESASTVSHLFRPAHHGKISKVLAVQVRTGCLFHSRSGEGVRSDDNVGGSEELPGSEHAP